MKLDMRAKPFTDTHRQRLKAAWTDARKQQASQARLGKRRGPYRKAA